MPDTDTAPSTGKPRPSFSILKQASSRAYAKQAVAKTIAAAQPFRRPEGEPNSLPLPPRPAMTPERQA